MSFGSVGTVHQPYTRRLGMGRTRGEVKGGYPFSRSDSGFGYRSNLSVLREGKGVPVGVKES